MSNEMLTEQVVDPTSFVHTVPSEIIVCFMTFTFVHFTRHINMFSDAFGALLKQYNKTS